MDKRYYAALKNIKEMGTTRGIDAVLEKHKLDALVLPANGYATRPAAIAGYPIITGTPAFQASYSSHPDLISYSQSL